MEILRYLNYWLGKKKPIESHDWQLFPLEQFPFGGGGWGCTMTLPGNFSLQTCSKVCRFGGILEISLLPFNL